MRNIRLLIEYDGTDFLGWQIQAEGRTVQGEIASVLARVLQHPVNLIGGGRTDAGVHARGQVANFRTNSGLATSSLHNALLGLLPDDVIVRAVDEVPEDFHARYGARERTYRYSITLIPRALGRAYCWHVTYRLEPSLLQAAAEAIGGVHDFHAFSKTGSDIEHYRCDVRSSFWNVEGSMLVYEIRADRFVRGMVRALVGTMVDVGRGAMSVDGFRGLLDSGDRSRAGTLAPACGLVLEQICY
jgi:tRNA pseudouridine38-40 synthase